MTHAEVRTFLEIDGPDDDANIERLKAMAEEDWHSQGRVLATYRPWPGPLFWSVVGLLALGSIALLVTAPDSEELVTRAILLPCVWVWVVAIVLPYYFDRHRVCEHGLVVGLRKRSRYVIPWSTIDPARVVVVRRLGWLVRRPEFPSSSPHYRFGFAGLHGLALNGLDTATHGWVQVPGLLEVQDPVRPGARGRRTPFVWWFLGTRRAADLARDIERAMVADGYPAHGLAEHAVRAGFTVPWRPTPESPLPPRMADDPVIGVEGLADRG